MGYPARSIFKLEEIQKKWSVMTRGRAVLDVGAAPGSWTLYALRTLGRGATVTAVDLKPMEIAAPAGCPLRFRQGVVGSRRSYDLVMRVIDLAEAHLADGGNLVVKVFQGGDEAEIRDRIRRLFRETKTFKPKAVRSESMETYMVGLGFRSGDGSEI